MAAKLIEAAPIVPLKEVRRFIMDCMMAVGVPRPHAESLGDVLAEADYRGHFSHGMNRLEMYVEDIRSGICDGSAVPKILKESPATAWVDGQNGLGVVVGNFCINLAIEKAKSVGIGWVVSKGSNHYGIAGYYSMQALKEGFLGMSFTNTSPFMTPTRAKNAALGTNPLSLATPANGGDSFVLDMATTAVAVGKIEIQRRKNQPIPDGWALNDEGKVETNAEIAYKSARLLPLGGEETHSGYKGFGLGMLVEIFCGILGGSAFGPNVRKWGTTEVEANLGQCFVAINPNCFAPNFNDRMSDLMNCIRHMEPAEPGKSVLVAGDPERSHMEAVDEAGGVRYVENQYKACENLARTLKVAPLNTKSV